ncbi:MAG: hypothetical protein AUJ12_01165 [Alphaproteobacteria bacterium CG1_02_46_17]|nr:MAG: hypothetical protein AUJ12_01165 [Alphaproteobacteria bacterium CG1_02_46_17]
MSSKLSFIGTRGAARFKALAKPLAQALLDYAVQKGPAFGVDQARVSILSVEKTGCNVEKGDMTEWISGKSFSVGICLYGGDKKLSFSVSSPDLEVACKEIDRKIQFLHIIPDNQYQKLLSPDQVYSGPMGLFDTYQPSPVKMPDMVDFAKRMESEAIKNPDVLRVESSGVSQVTHHVLVLATNGQDRSDSSTTYSAGISVVSIKPGVNGEDDEKCIGGAGSSASHFSDLDSPESLGKKAAEEAVKKLSLIKPASGKVSIVLSHDAAEQFYRIVMNAIDGTVLLQKASFLQKKMGEQVLSPDVTIEDLPHVKRSLHSAFVDSSGQKSEPITFIKNGVLQQFNVSLEEARQLGLDPIGRNDGVTNLRICPGSVSPDNLISDIEEGVYIDSFDSGISSTNNGIFSRPAQGMRIHKGKITHQSVGDFIVTGQLQDMFMNLVLANDTPQLPSSCHAIVAPTTRINGVNIV